MISFRVCGPKLSTCCALLSVWGIIQLSLMAIFMYFNSVAFIEDLKLPKGEDDYKDADELFQDITKGYGETAKNCGIAVALYALTFCISIHQVCSIAQGQLKYFLINLLRTVRYTHYFLRDLTSKFSSDFFSQNIINRAF